MVTDNLEMSLVLIKPDALKNSLTGYVLSQLSEFHTGLHFAATKIVSVSTLLAEEHYAEHKGKFFYPSLLEYIMGQSHYPDEPWKRRVIAIVYQGEDAISKIREIVGPTNPHNARVERPGSIRSLGTVVPLKDDSGKVVDNRVDNMIHASANNEDAEREIKLWFRPTDIPPFMRGYDAVVSKEHYYYKDGMIHTTFEPDSVGVIAPGDLVWTTDIEALKLHCKGESAPISVNNVAAKYLINIEVAPQG